MKKVQELLQPICIVSQDEDSDSERDIEESLAGLTGMELSIKRWDLNRQKEGKEPWRPNKNNLKTNKKALNN